jgi:hypothetical protein
MEANNVSFQQGDMMTYAQGDLSSFDFIFLLYNFHHIKDVKNETDERKANANKQEFLRNCYKNMKAGSYLCVADIFVPSDNTEVAKLFARRIEEGYFSTFWNALTSLKKLEISSAQRTASYCRQNEHEIGLYVQEREHEYPITLTWLEECADKLGFAIILNEEVNVVGDAIVLIKKE